LSRDRWSAGILPVIYLNQREATSRQDAGAPGGHGQTVSMGALFRFARKS
jgi:hypothetical protein